MQVVRPAHKFNAFYIVTCPECRGTRVLPGRVICWKCEGEGRILIPDFKFRYEHYVMGRRLAIAVWTIVVVLLGVVAVVVNFR